jgi:hypothetical protein
MSDIAVASLVVLAVVSVIWTVVLLAVALEIRRVSWRIQEFIRSLELELKPTIHEAREAIRTLNQAAQGAADSTERIRGALLKLERVGENVRAATGSIRSVLGPPLIPFASLLAGARAGTKVLWKLYTRRRAAK